MTIVHKAVTLLELCFATQLLAQRPEDDVFHHFMELLAWLQEGINAAGLDAKFPLLNDTFELRMTMVGKSLFAKRDIERGATIGLFPVSRLVFERDFGGILEGASPNQTTPDKEAIVFVAKQRQAKEASLWAPWVNILPQVHTHLPKYWEPSFLNAVLQGSYFLDYVNERREILRTDWEQVRTAANISWLDFEWGCDIYASRQFVWNGTGSSRPKPGTRAFYPLVDLITHGNENIDFTFDNELQALRLFATNPIHTGDEFFSEYFTSNEMDNFALLEMGGFALAGNVKRVVLQIPDAKPLFKLEATSQSRDARQFLAYLRARVNPNGTIDISDHFPAEKDWIGVPDATTGWLYFWNSRTGETSWSPPGDPDSIKGGPILTPASTWGVEIEALRLGQTFLEAALARYPETILQDEVLLAGDIPDLRVRFAVMLRRDEKFVLSWWLRLIHRAMAHAKNKDAQVGVEEAHLDDEDVDVGHGELHLNHSEL